MNQLGYASGCCVFFFWINTKKISRLFSDILFYNHSSPSLLDFSWTDLWSTSHFLVWQCWNLGLLQVAFNWLENPFSSPALALAVAARTGWGSRPAALCRAQCAGAAARGQPPAAQGARAAPGGAGAAAAPLRSGDRPGVTRETNSSLWQTALSVKTSSHKCKSSQNKVNLLYSRNLFRGPLFLELLHLFLIGVDIIKLFNLLRCTWFMTRLLVGCAQLLLAPEAVLSVCSVIGGTQSEFSSKNSKNWFVNR